MGKLRATHRPPQSPGADAGLVAAVVHARRGRARGSILNLGLLSLVALLSATGCVTVRPEQRAILADPVMRFDGNAPEDSARQHVFENREGSFGAGSVEGGGCGCN